MPIDAFASYAAAAFSCCRSPAPPLLMFAAAATMLARCRYAYAFARSYDAFDAARHIDAAAAAAAASRAYIAATLLLTPQEYNAIEQKACE